MGHASGKLVVDAGGAFGKDAVGLGVGAPQDFDGGLFDGAGGEVVRAETVDGGGGALGFASDGVGEGESDRGESGGDPEDGEKGAPAIVPCASWSALWIGS